MNPSSTTGTRCAAPGQDHAGEPGDLEAADLREHVERVRGSGRFSARARRTASTLRRRPAVVHARAAAGDARRRWRR